MSHAPLNLARRPFVNARPVVRAAAALWALGGLLCVLNLVLYWGHIRGTRELRAQLAAAEAAIDRAQNAMAAAAADLEARDLQRQNAEVTFLNRCIAERTFGWSTLFERLGEVLPREVRIYSLAPVNILGERRRGRTESAAADAFALHVAGAAAGDEQLLELIDAFFAHPAFSEPKLARETREGAELQFDLAVTYRPPAPEPE